MNISIESVNLLSHLRHCLGLLYLYCSSSRVLAFSTSLCQSLLTWKIESYDDDEDNKNKKQKKERKERTKEISINVWEGL